MFDRVGVELMSGQEPVNRRQAKGARLEDALFQQLAHQHLDLELGMLPAEVQQRLARLRA